MGEEIRRQQARSVIIKCIDWLKKRSLRQIVLSVLLLLFIAWVAERLINAGTFFGYQVRGNDNTTKAVGDEQVKTFACNKLTAEEVGDVLGAGAMRIGGVFPDKTTPNLISTCSYKIGNEETRSVSVLVRDAENKRAAQSAFENLKKRNNYEAIPDFDEQAIFTPISRQLNVITKDRIVSVTVSDPTNTSSIANKDAVIELYKKFDN